MDIYQCMTCGERRPHGMWDGFLWAAGHADQTRGNPEGMHRVLVGERMTLEAQYARVKSGEPLTEANDQEQMRPVSPSLPEPPPHNLSTLARRLGVTEEQARELVQSLFEPPKRELPANATDDVIPPGQLTVWGGER